jgi:hypothetical protein
MMKVQNTELPLRQMMVIESTTKTCVGIAGGNETNAYRILFGKPHSEVPLGTRRSRWKHNVKVDIREIVCENVNFLRIGTDMGQVLVYSVNRTKHINTLYGQNAELVIFKAGGTHTVRVRALQP